MKPWVAKLIRGLLVTIVGFVGLVGLLMSACGLLVGSAGSVRGLYGAAALGLVSAVACLGFVVWVSITGERGLRIALGIFLGCVLLAWLLLGR